MPELAYETVRVEIDMGENPFSSGDFPLMVAKRSEISAVLDF